MYNRSKPTPARRAAGLTCSAIFLVIVMAGAASAHPLGQFTINHFSRLAVGTNRVSVRYVVDMAEIPTFQELQAMGSNGSQTSSAELETYVERAAARYADGMLLTVDGTRVPLQVVARKISLVAGAGGLHTLRIECDFAGDLADAAPAAGETANQTRRLKFENTNYRERAGWRETVVVPANGVSVFDSTAFGTALTDELKVYPEDLLAAPLDERAVQLSFTSGAIPTNAAALRARDGRTLAQSRDRFAELISVQELTPTIALFGLLVAAALGALHAFSPGHGKTVVGAYLVGSRGTARHAAFLGLTVTVTHTAGVFALGLVTLFASQYIVPERLFPILGVVSGGIVLVMGLSLFASRLLAALGLRSHDHGHTHGDEHAHDHTHDAAHSHIHGHAHDHTHDGDPTVPHSHGGGRAHTHLPPGTDGSRVTWRSLLALGISGGLLPCPSALVVLLSAISLHRVGYGMMLVVAFSVGLAGTLTAIGLAFVYAGRFILNRAGAGVNRLARVLPVASAFVVACLGAALCYEALGQAGIHLTDMLSSNFAFGETEAGGEQTLASMGAWAVLGLGLVFGLKHATEVDHIVAVTTIVSEQRNLLRAALVGALWGAGHTVSLIAVGIVVLALRVAIPELVASWLEFGVALMIIGLGLSALVRVLRRRSDVHVHEHLHDDQPHAHIHFHEEGTEHTGSVAPHTHAVARVGLKPLLVGAMHGLAGSAALTLLVLTQIASPLVGLLYLFVFGLGSIFGMLLMSCLVGLPFVLGARKLTRMNYALQAAASVLSIAFGLWYAYEVGTASGFIGRII